MNQKGRISLCPTLAWRGMVGDSNFSPLCSCLRKIAVNIDMKVQINFSIRQIAGKNLYTGRINGSSILISSANCFSFCTAYLSGTISHHCNLSFSVLKGYMCFSRKWVFKPVFSKGKKCFEDERQVWNFRHLKRRKNTLVYFARCCCKPARFLRVCAFPWGLMRPRLAENFTGLETGPAPELPCV